MINQPLGAVQQHGACLSPEARVQGGSRAGRGAGGGHCAVSWAAGGGDGLRGEPVRSWERPPGAAVLQSGAQVRGADGRGGRPSRRRAQSWVLPRSDLSRLAFHFLGDFSDPLGSGGRRSGLGRPKGCGHWLADSRAELWEHPVLAGSHGPSDDVGFDKAQSLLWSRLSPTSRRQPASAS